MDSTRPTREKNPIEKLISEKQKEVTHSHTV